MNWNVWNEVEPLLIEHGIQPILAVVPDNQDEKLQVCDPDRHFWDRVRDWQARGWTIAMHGWQHRFVTTEPGLLRINRYSEFAGLERQEQENKLKAGIRILQMNGIPAHLWIAPAHSFDAVTVELLAELGFRYISDGFFPVPHVDKSGLLWVPQQLWSFRWRPFGVWTICLHINSWSKKDIDAFREGLLRNLNSMSGFEAIAKQYAGRRETIFDNTFAGAYSLAAQVIPGTREMISNALATALRSKS